MFKVNEGPIDRFIRSVFAIILIGIGFFSNGILSIILSILGGILLFTAITGFCGLYVLLGINTCPLKKDKK
ncbi:MAG: DUF2892 domain-containing protein [Endomicrobiia bacterium]